MPKGAGGRFRRVVSGLLVLVLLAVGSASAGAAVAPVAYAGLGATAIGVDQGEPTATSAHTCRDAGAPCPTPTGPHGAVCCLTFGCSAGTVALPTAITVMRMRLASGVTYRTRSTVRPDGLGQAPALPPPRAIV